MPNDQHLQSFPARFGSLPKLNSANIFECPVWSQIAKFNVRQYFHLYGSEKKHVHGLNLKNYLTNKSMKVHTYAPYYFSLFHTGINRIILTQLPLPLNTYLARVVYIWPTSYADTSLYFFSYPNRYIHNVLFSPTYPFSS